MKKNVMVLVLMLVSTIIFAQRHPQDPKAMADKRSDRMKTELSLNDEQYSKVKAINEQFADRHQQLRSDTSLTVGAMRGSMKSLMTEQDAQLKNVLTADQWTKWTALKARKRENFKKHKQGKTDNG